MALHSNLDNMRQDQEPITTPVMPQGRTKPPSSSTAHHLREHPTSIQMQAGYQFPPCLHWTLLLKGWWYNLNRYLCVCEASCEASLQVTANRNTACKHISVYLFSLCKASLPFTSFHCLFWCWAQKSQRKRVERKRDVGECNWESIDSVLSHCQDSSLCLFPKDRRSNQRS